MSRWQWLVAICVLGLAGLPASAAHARTASGNLSFGAAQQIRMPRNAAGFGSLTAVACPGIGDCVAGGWFATQTGAGGVQAMTVTQFDGGWHRAGQLRLPHDAYVTQGAEVTAVACGRAGSCVAVGTYLAAAIHSKSHSDFDIGEDTHGFIAADSGGKWYRAQTVRPPGNAYRSGYGASLTGVSCPKPGWCEAIGNYTDRHGRHESFAVAQVRGRWQRAVELEMPQHALANPGAFLTGISCWRAGFCAAVGQYQIGFAAYLSAGLVQRGGRWDRATELRPPANSDSSYSVVDHVACPASGDCLAVGVYVLQPGDDRALAVTEAGAHWARASEITASPAGATDTDLDAISCPAAALCYGAGGFNEAGGSLAFALTRSHGRWSDPEAISLPANAATGSQASAVLNAVSCSSAGYCAAVGDYAQITSGQPLAMVTETP